LFDVVRQTWGNDVHVLFQLSSLPLIARWTC
jgi:hypothetical protein